MSQILFDKETINLLRENPYVKEVSEKSITYTSEFREKFVVEYESGKSPSQIFREAGFDVKKLGRERIKSITSRCRKMAIRETGFEDTRSKNSGRPSTRELTPEEQLERLKHKVKYLEQENEFLKKIKFLDRQADWKEKRKRRQKKNLNSSTK